MVQDSHGLHHYHKRKWAQQENKKYVHSNELKHLMDKLIYIVGIAGPLMTIPQLAKIWVDKNVAGVSALSWGAYSVIAVFWLVYGVLHKDKPIIITSILWIFFDVLIVIGVLIHG